MRISKGEINRATKYHNAERNGMYRHDDVEAQRALLAAYFEPRAQIAEASKVESALAKVRNQFMYALSMLDRRVNKWNKINFSS